MNAISQPETQSRVGHTSPAHGPDLPGPDYPSDFATAARDLLRLFPCPDLCERLAMKSLETAVCLLLHIEKTCPDAHPLMSEDSVFVRAYTNAERAYWRALSYLQRRLDHRARLAARAANPSDAYAATLYKPDQTPQPRTNPQTTPQTPDQASRNGSMNHTQVPAKSHVMTNGPAPATAPVPTRPGTAPQIPPTTPDPRSAPRPHNP